MKYKMFTTVALVAALTGCSGGEAKVTLPSAAPDAPIETMKPANEDSAKAKLASGALNSAIFTGSIETYRSTDVATNVGGLIRKVYVEEGQIVAEGDPLVDIDPAEYRLRVQSAEAAQGRAKAQVQMLESQYNRVKRLLDKKAATDSDYDMIAGQLAVARAAVAETNVGVSMARKMLSDSKIRAPYDSVVTKVNTAEGEFAGVGPAPLVMVTEIGHLRARIQLPEHYISQVAVGDKLKMRIPSTGQAFEGVVERVNPSVQQGSRSFAVLTSIDNTELKLRPGMFVEAQLETAAQGVNP